MANQTKKASSPVRRMLAATLAPLLLATSCARERPPEEPKRESFRHSIISCTVLGSVDMYLVDADHDGNVDYINAIGRVPGFRASWRAPEYVSSGSGFIRPITENKFILSPETQRLATQLRSAAEELAYMMAIEAYRQETNR